MLQVHLAHLVLRGHLDLLELELRDPQDRQALLAPYTPGKELGQPQLYTQLTTVLRITEADMYVLVRTHRVIQMMNLV